MADESRFFGTEYTPRGKSGAPSGDIRVVPNAPGQSSTPPRPKTPPPSSWQPERISGHNPPAQTTPPQPSPQTPDSGRPQSITPPANPPPPSDSQHPKSSHLPSIRTMKSDVDAVLRYGRPPIGQMLNTDGPTFSLLKKQRAVRWYIALALAGLLFLGGGGALYYLKVFLHPARQSQEIKRFPPPAPLFTSDASRTITIAPGDAVRFKTLMEDSLREFEREGTVKRILVKVEDAIAERYLATAEFFQLYRIQPPTNVLSRLDSVLMTYVSYGPDGSRLGIAARTKDRDRTLRDLLEWEPGMANALRPLLFNEIVQSPIGSFEDRSYRNIDWRYLKLSPEEDVGIAYGVFPAGNILVITTSKTSMETTINRLFDAR